MKKALITSVAMAVLLALPAASQAAYLPASVLRSASHQLLNNILVNSPATGGHIVACARTSYSAGRCTFVVTFATTTASTCTGVMRIVMPPSGLVRATSHGTGCY